jgi:GNAT superfamily N-acetyltransferase
VGFLRGVVAAGDDRQRSIVADVLSHLRAVVSLVAHDLASRPELTPWLAGVFVVPQARRRSHATRLTEAVEEACRSAAIPTLWLYTLTAERLYARAGWVTVESFDRHGRPAALMRRDLATGS